MMSLRTALLITSVLSSGLVAGLFFGWTVSVIPGTKVIDDQTYVTTMQSINREILNPLFLVTFLATPVVLAGAGFVHYRAGNTRAAGALATATVTYLIGVMAVTAGGNVPLNDSLEAFDLASASVEELRSRRVSYETRWNQWHNLRTVASIAALAFAAYACVLAPVE